MSAIKLEILSRYRQRPAVIASSADFECSVGEEIDSAAVADDARVTLYCLDHERRRAIFAALPADIDLSAAPFMYQAQFDGAQYLIALPYADFLRLADTFPPPGAGLVCLHNIGRCGSTVLSRALNAVEGLLSLSEPDVLTNFIFLRDVPLVERLGLLRASAAWLFRPAIVGANERASLKFRNQAAGIIDLYMAALPDAIHIFMYRNVLSWLASFHRFWVQRGDAPLRYTRAEIIAQQSGYFHCDAAAFEALLPDTAETYHLLEGRALGWVYMLERYLELAESGADIAALRYEDLQSEGRAALRQLLSRMGLPDSALSRAERAFADDSQAGTPFARAGDRGNTLALPAEMAATVERLLAAQQVVNRADFLLPGTIAAD